MVPVLFLFFFVSYSGRANDANLLNYRVKLKKHGNQQFYLMSFVYYCLLNGKQGLVRLFA